MLRISPKNLYRLCSKLQKYERRQKTNKREILQHLNLCSFIAKSTPISLIVQGQHQKRSRFTRFHIVSCFRNCHIFFYLFQTTLGYQSRNEEDPIFMPWNNWDRDDFYSAVFSHTKTPTYTTLFLSSKSVKNLSYLKNLYLKNLNKIHSVRSKLPAIVSIFSAYNYPYNSLEWKI